MAARGGTCSDGTTAGGTSSDQDDFVDYEEFESIMLSLTGGKDNWPESKLRELFENLDADGSGKVSLEKFFQRSLVDAKRSRGSSLGMHDLFVAADADGSGLLNFHEFASVCSQLGYSDVASELFETFDVDQSGSLNYNELASAVSVRVTANGAPELRSLTLVDGVVGKRSCAL